MLSCKCQCDSHLENTKAHVSLLLCKLSDNLFIHGDRIKKKKHHADKCVSCRCMWHGLFSHWLMGFVFVLFCFPIQQFNEKLKEQTSNPWQQPCNPWFVMLSMLHCKHIQTAYQGSKHRKDLLSCGRSLPLRTWCFFYHLYTTIVHLKQKANKSKWYK